MVGSPHFVSLLGNFLTFIFGNMGDKEVVYSYTSAGGGSRLLLPLGGWSVPMSP